MNKGYVYVLSNPSMPGIVKIGRTKFNASFRASQLYQTGVPTPFVVEGEVYSPDCIELEAFVHSAMPDLRVNDMREFFRATPQDALELVQHCLKEQLDSIIEEFAPGNVIAFEPLVVSEDTIYRLAEGMAESPYDVASAMGYLEPEDLAQAMSKWAKVKADRLARLRGNRG